MKHLSRKSLVLVIVVALGGIIGFGAARSISASSKKSPENSIHRVNLNPGGPDVTAIAVKKGESVQFNAKDGKQHNISQGQGNHEVHQSLGIESHEHTANGKESGVFGAGEAYLVTMNKPGTYSFHDHFNPKISVTVVVYEEKS